MNITGIEVEYSRTVQVQQYEPAFAKATIRAVFKEDETTDVDAALRETFSYAVKHVRETVGLKTTTALPASTRGATAEQAGVKTETPTKSAKATKTETKKSALDMDDEPELPKNLDRRAKPAETKASAVSMDDEEETVTKITDGELNLAIGKMVTAFFEAGREDGSEEVKKIVAGYNPAPGKPFTAREIPQGKRSEFLESLTAKIAEVKKTK